MEELAEFANVQMLRLSLCSWSHVYFLLWSLYSFKPHGMRDANRGGCSQSCRWKYDLYDMPFGQERKSLER